jgi:SPP1 family holin
MKPSKETIVRTIALAVATINALAVMWGFNPLPYDQEQVYAALSGVVEVALVIWSWWKNNSFTEAAIKADEYGIKLKGKNV